MNNIIKALEQLTVTLPTKQEKVNLIKSLKDQEYNSAMYTYKNSRIYSDYKSELPSL